MSVLRGKRILLVEDEFVIAVLAEDMLAELGATVVGPAGTIAQGLRLAEADAIDAAVRCLRAPDRDHLRIRVPGTVASKPPRS